MGIKCSSRQSKSQWGFPSSQLVLVPSVPISSAPTRNFSRAEIIGGPVSFVGTPSAADLIQRRQRSEFLCELFRSCTLSCQ
ncbi:hypothetical protein O6P43_015331 [Quillaja saponaria]|uniref:Uncharacterized protein n=1 Tax=Quillaja saponaria TaxID=32244 RepID=A0AAD7PSE9_QUISA|nr:hypothetical protein O6P43_015331 [Quillaja saponaria]